MSLPYFPLFVDDYEADTAHLSLAEDGAYNRILRLCWRSPECSIPDDKAWIKRKLRVSEKEFNKVIRPIIDEFFATMSGRIFSPRLSEEYNKAHEKHLRRAAAGRKGGITRALKDKEKTSGNAQAKLKQPEPEPEPEPKHRYPYQEERTSELGGTREVTPFDPVVVSGGKR